MPQISRRKYLRSPFFANPANWETLLRRTSTKRCAPELRSFEKKASADFLVNPIVKTLMPMLPLANPHQHTQFAAPGVRRHRQSIPLWSDRGPCQTFLIFESILSWRRYEIPDCHLREYE